MYCFKFFTLLFIVFFHVNFLVSAPHTLHPHVNTFLTNFNSPKNPPIYTLTPDKARKVLEDFQVPSFNEIPADVQDMKIPGTITKEISLRIVRPLGSKQKKLPVILYMHGGGWILGSKNTHDRLIRRIANEAQAAVIIVDYSLSPEAKYPVAIEQGYEALQYIAKQGNSLSVDTKKIAIVGDSVGGLMATALTQLSKQRSGPKIVYQVLFYPVTDANFNTASYQEFAEGFWLTKKAMMWFWDAYADPSIRKQPGVAPLQTSIDQLRGLPPAFIITDEHDVLRDEGEAYARKLMQAGVEVVAIRMLGTIHDFVLLDTLKNAAETNAAINFACLQLKQAFSKV